VGETEALRQNLQTFERRLPTLLLKHRGQYVVIAQGEIVEICKTYEAAIKFGYSNYPSEDQYHLLQQVVPIPDRADLHLAPD